MQSFRKQQASAIQFYKQLTEFVVAGVQLDEYSLFKLHSLTDKLKMITSTFGCIDSINVQFELQEQYPKFSSALQSIIKQIRSLSDELIRGFQSDALKLSTVESPRPQDVEHHKSQMTKYFSSEKEPIQWQIETNASESNSVLSCLQSLYDERETLHQFNFVNWSGQECSNLSCIRLVESFVWEKGFLEKQLNVIKDLTMSIQMNRLKLKVETFLDEISQRSALQWIVRYVQHCHSMTRHIQETNILFRKLQHQIEINLEKNSTAGFTDENSVSKISIQLPKKQKRLKQKPNIYKCSDVGTSSWTNVSGNKLYSYQPTVISEEHYGSISNDYEKHKSIEVLEHKDYQERRVRVNKEIQPLQERTSPCLDCSIQ